MREAATVAVLLLVTVAVLWSMLRGWRRRSTGWVARVPEPPLVPERSDDLGTTLAGPVEATYVSTTTADPLVRVVAHDLGVRSAAEVSVHEAGVVVRRAGARDLLVPVDALVDVQTLPGMAGKHVGGRGLVVVRWTLGDEPVQTGLRTRYRADQATLVDAVGALARHATEHRPAGSGQSTHTEEQA